MITVPIIMISPVQPWKSCRQVVFIVCTVCLLYVLLFRNEIREKVIFKQIVPAEEVNWKPLQTHIQIQPINYVVNPNNDELNKEARTASSWSGRVIYNRVGKCGSRSILTLMKDLSKLNKFEVVSDDISNRMAIPLIQQKELVDFLNKKSPPFLFQRHLHFLEFERFTNWTPVYINMIRDPIDRLVSAYYFGRFGDGRNDKRTWSFGGSYSQKYQTFDECVLHNRSECSTNRAFYIIPFFCGQTSACLVPSRWALEKAKKNVLEKYSVVGLTEQFEQFIAVLEKVLPSMFDGAVQLWKKKGALKNEKISSTQTLRKIPPSQQVRAIMRQRLQYEYEFYDFVKIHFTLLKHNLGINQTSGAV